MGAAEQVRYEDAAHSFLAEASPVVAAEVVSFLQGVEVHPACHGRLPRRLARSKQRFRAASGDSAPAAGAPTELHRWDTTED